MTYENINRIADEMLPAETPQQRFIVLQQLVKAIDITETDGTAQKRLAKWKVFFGQVVTDSSKK